jgi:hypothetical protein
LKVRVQFDVQLLLVWLDSDLMTSFVDL